MKILLISSIYPTAEHPDYGVYVRNIHDLFLASGHEVTLIAFQRQGRRREKWDQLKRFYQKINQALDHQEAYDLINIQYPYLSALPIRLRLHKIRIPILVSVHGSDVFQNSLSKRLLFLPTLGILKKSRGIIVPSVFFREKMLSALDLKPGQFFVCPAGGFDGDIFFPLPPGSRSEKIVPSKEDPDTRRIGFVGRLTEGKGWRVLLEAFARLSHSDQVPNCHLIIAGTGPDESRILERVQELKMEDRVVLTGALKPRELAEFYRSLDLLVFPTMLEEALGLVGLEALACGVPVIASNLGAVPEYIVPGHNGELVKPGDAQDLETAITEFLGRSERERREYSRQATDSVKNYEKRFVGKQLDHILAEVIQ